MDEIFTGKYKLESSENFEEYMKSIGVGLVMRKLGNTAKPELTIWKDGDLWTMKSSTTFKAYEQKFEMNKESPYETPGGKNVISTFTQDGNKWIEVQRNDADNFETKLVREFDADGITMTLEHNDVKCVRRYSRVKA
nr:FABP1 [Echiniscoides sigismundi]